MGDSGEKFVAFTYWCPRCKHRKTDETEDPCNECLTSPVNQNSRKPIRFESEDE